MSTREAPLSSPNWPLLSLLRLFLASYVFISHLPGFYPDAPSAPDMGNVSAVAGFFLISGYSIAHSLQREKRGFYARRINRIYPEILAGWALVTLAFVHAGAIIQTPRNSYELPANLGAHLIHLLPGWSWVFPAPSWNPPLWSLGIEVLIYAFAPLLIRLSMRAIWGVMLASLALYVGSLAFHFRLGINELSAVYAYLWLWLLGYLLAVAPSKLTHYAILSAVPILWTMGGTLSVTPINACLIVACVVLTHQSEFAIPARFKKLANWLGGYSYTLYALHFPLWIALSEFAGVHDWRLGAIGAAVGAALIFQLIESRRQKA